MVQAQRDIVYAVSSPLDEEPYYSAAFQADPTIEREKNRVWYQIGHLRLFLVADGASGAPRPDALNSPINYWQIEEPEDFNFLVEKLGGTVKQPLTTVGKEIQAGIVLDRRGNRIGVLHNPNYPPLIGQSQTVRSAFRYAAWAVGALGIIALWRSETRLTAPR